MKKYLKYIISIILIIIFVFSVVPKNFQNDTFYIIALGEQILEDGLDKVDHFSWHNNLEYRYPHWLFDIINAEVFDAFGLNGIYVLVCFVSVIFMLVLFWILVKKKNNWFLSLCSTLLVTYLIRNSFTGRAQIVSYILFLIEIQLIELFIKKKSKLSCLGILIISSIIANIHATAWIMTLVLFLPYIGEYIFVLYTLEEINNRQEKRYIKEINKLKKSQNKDNQEKIKKLEQEIEHCKIFRNREKKEENHKIIIKKMNNEKWLFIPLICAIIGAMITPIGITPFTYYFKINVGNTMGYINEHLPVIPANSLEFLVFTIVVIALIGFTNSKLKLSDAFLILGLYLMSLSARRNCYLMIPLCCIPITKMIQDFLDFNLQKGTSNFDSSTIKFFKILFTIFTIGILGISIYNYIKSSNVPYVDPKTYPTKAIDFVKNELDLNEIKLYNSYHTGSYILMNGIPVFIDSRCDLYTPEFNKGVVVFDDYMDVQYGKSTIFEILDKYEMTHCIIAKNSIEYTYMKDDYRCINLYEDDNFVVFEYKKAELVME
ncbi:MAG: hypothetical protein HFJ45_01355 [Clostridia bacterium]|nr:hypothetical protein [Clostridia bacterium]